VDFVARLWIIVSRGTIDFEKIMYTAEGKEMADIMMRYRSDFANAGRSFALRHGYRMTM